MGEKQKRIKNKSKMISKILLVLSWVNAVCLAIPIIVLIWHMLHPSFDFMKLGKEQIFYSMSGQYINTSGELLAEMSLILLSGIVMLGSLILLYGIFRSMYVSGTPFCFKNSNRMKILSVIFIGYAIIQPLLKNAVYRRFAPELSVYTTLNINIVILAIIVSFITLVFDYGVQLQKQADETL